MTPWLFTSFYLLFFLEREVFRITCSNFSELSTCSKENTKLRERKRESEDDKIIFYRAQKSEKKKMECERMLMIVGID